MEREPLTKPPRSEGAFGAAVVTADSRSEVISDQQPVQARSLTKCTAAIPWKCSKITEIVFFFK